MANDKTMVTIDPAGFTDTQWEEIHYASDLITNTWDHGGRDGVDPFQAKVEDVQQAAECCRSKAVRVRDGELGIEGGEEQWAADLESAATVLEALVPTEVVPLTITKYGDAGEVVSVEHSAATVVRTPGELAAVLGPPISTAQLDAYDQHGRPAPGYAERLAVEFNARVWGSAEMTAAVLACADAHSELVTGKGWGLLALGNAEGQLLKALGMIRAMKGWR